MIGNLGFPEILLILLVVLLLFGAKRIPEIAGSMGKGIREFKRNINEATREVREVTEPGPADKLTPPADDSAKTDAGREPKRLMQ